MTEPRQHLRHRCHDLPGRQGWSVDHYERNSQGAGGQYFGLCPTAACVFGDNMGDVVVAQEVRVTGHIERATRNDHAGLRQGQCGRRINKAQQVMVLGFGGKGIKALLANGKEHLCRGIRQGNYGRSDIGDVGPIVALRGVPGRAFQGQELHAARKAGIDGIPAHPSCKGVGGIDDMGDLVGLHIVTQARHTAKAADPRGQRLRHGAGGAPGIGKHGVHALRREGCGKAACFGSSPQQEKAHG